MESVALKISSGTWRRCRLEASSRRIKPAALFRPLTAVLACSIPSMELIYTVQ